MALTNLQANITLDVYDHDGAKPSIKTIALDDNTRYVLANIRSRGEVYDIGSSATVQLIVIRPDKVGVQIAGQAQGIEIGQEDESVVTVYGAYAELDQAAIVLPGTLLGQFKITDGTQILRTQVFQILNGEALDSDTWAGDYDGYNLDELVADVAEAVEKVGDLETDVAQIKEDLNAVFEKIYRKINVTEIGDITKLAGVSFAPSGSYVVGSANALFDSYYFYADEDTAVYFDSIDQNPPAYIAITVGYNPTKEWVTYQGNPNSMLCESPIRYRNANSNLPISNNPLDVSSAIVILTVTANTTTTMNINDKTALSENVGLPLVQTTGQNTNKAMSQKAITDAINSASGSGKSYLRYTNGAGSGFSTERLDIFVAKNNGYIRYEFVHSVNAERNSNVWRIDGAYKTDANFTDVLTITTTGEWELAVKIVDREDFSGGMIHGDEVHNNIAFFVDGVKTDITALTALSEFRQLQIVQDSQLYDPADSQTVIANHGSLHIFDATAENDLTIKQSVTWLGTYGLTYSYLAMFPVAQSAVDYILTDKDYTERQITNFSERDIEDVAVYNANSNINCFCKFGISEYPEYPNDAYNKRFSVSDNGGTAYHKCYYSVCGNGTSVNASTLWKTTTLYNIE